MICKFFLYLAFAIIVSVLSRSRSDEFDDLDSPFN
jgi:hypothetical protein